jgi:hypothetical protein
MLGLQALRSAKHLGQSSGRQTSCTGYSPYEAAEKLFFGGLGQQGNYFPLGQDIYRPVIAIYPYPVSGLDLSCSLDGAGNAGNAILTSHNNSMG